jgi:hypothetical protein
MHGDNCGIIFSSEVAVANGFVYERGILGNYNFIYIGAPNPGKHTNFGQYQSGIGSDQFGNIFGIPGKNKDISFIKHYIRGYRSNPE